MSTKSHYRTARKHLNKHVKVKTKYGSTFYGEIIKVSPTKMYLKVSSVKSHYKAHTSFAPFILPLVLFDLLAIVLVATPRRRFFF
ncbi:hypothetical protein PMSD_08210 [Paenibacillus macquariensis subsp. defensor]|nr:hypothetical protein PMSD_08210 [Paenibacillus macquariensis subsp. defensor]